MALAQLPTESEIRLASRLRPEQVSIALADTTALETDIASRITEQANYVEMRLYQASAPNAYPITDAILSTAYPAFDSDQRASVTTRQAGIAELAVKWLTIGDLYDSAGQLNERYQAEADNYKARGEKLLEQLEGELRWIVGRSGDSSSDGVAMVTVTVGENFDLEDEY